MANPELAKALLAAAASINPYSRNRFGNLAGAISTGLGTYQQGQQEAQQKQAIASVGGEGPERYKALAQYWADKDPAKAKQYLDLAASLSPQKPKGFGQTFTSNGRIYQLTDSGEPIDLGPAPQEAAKAPTSRVIKKGSSEVTQEWDGSKWVDVATAPRELGGGSGQLVQTLGPDGKPRFERVPSGGLPAGVPIPPGYSPDFHPVQAGPFTLADPKAGVEQRKVFGYVDRMVNAENEIAKVASGTPTEATGVIGAIPLIGSYAKRKTQTPEQQQYETLANEWIRAKLRKESGASIPPEEMAQEFETYFPQPGDDKDRIEAKRKLRAQAINSTAKESGARGNFAPSGAAPKIKRYNPATGRIE